MMRTLRQLILEEKCPYCGDPQAYVGMSDVECPNKNCKGFSQRQADDMKPKSKKLARPDPANPDPFSDKIWDAVNLLHEIDEREVDDYNANNNTTSDDDDGVTLADVAAFKANEAADLIDEAIASAPDDEARHGCRAAANQMRNIDWHSMSPDEFYDTIEDIEETLASVLTDADYAFDDAVFADLLIGPS